MWEFLCPGGLYVFERGEIIFGGKPAEVYHDEYLLRILGGTPPEPGERF